MDSFSFQIIYKYLAQIMAIGISNVKQKYVPPYSWLKDLQG